MSKNNSSDNLLVAVRAITITDEKDDWSIARDDPTQTSAGNEERDEADPPLIPQKTRVSNNLLTLNQSTSIHLVIFSYILLM